MKKLNPEFIEFLKDAKTEHGYGGQSVSVNSRVGDSREIIWGRDGWKYVDRWIGGNPFVGTESVSHIKTAVWGMAYHGKNIDSGFSNDDLNDWLSEVLIRPQNDLPIRGPFRFKKDGGEYNMSYDGRLENFEATESITQNGKIVYVAKFIGGLANVNTWPEKQPWMVVSNDEA